MGSQYTKANLVAELALSANISRKRAALLLDTLAKIAYREAPRKFTVPGICRLDVVHRQARRARNPATGETLAIAEHDVLRTRPLRKARLAVAPPPPNLVQVLPAGAPESGPAGEAPAPAAAAPAAPGASPQPDQFVSFRCGSCSQEIEAPLDMAGTASECPSCGNAIIIPFSSEPGTLWGAPASQQTVEPAGDAPAEQPATHEAMKSRTIRIELPDDF